MQIQDLVTSIIQAMLLVLWLSMPPIVVASVVGILFSLIQALTQIQEQTLSFGVKLIAVGATLYLTARWIGGEMYNYAQSLFDMFPQIIKWYGVFAFSIPIFMAHSEFFCIAKSTFYLIYIALI